MRTHKQVLYIFTMLIIYCTSFAEIDVFVDPGHGGTDPGSPTHISNYNEDNINLDIALKLSIIKTQNGNINVMYKGEVL